MIFLKKKNLIGNNDFHDEDLDLQDCSFDDCTLIANNITITASYCSYGYIKLGGKIKCKKLTLKNEGQDYALPEHYEIEHLHLINANLMYLGNHNIKHLELENQGHIRKYKDIPYVQNLTVRDFNIDASKWGSEDLWNINVDNLTLEDVVCDKKITVKYNETLRLKDVQMQMLFVECDKPIEMGNDVFIDYLFKKKSDTGIYKRIYTNMIGFEEN